MTQVESAAAAVQSPAKKSVKAKSTKMIKSRAPRNYPSFQVMIGEAIAAMKERTGSSQIAIAKYIEDNHKNLPPNFRKLLLNQLKRLVAAEKLVKVKASFKLPSTRSSSPAVTAPAAKKSAVEKPKAATAKPKAKPAAAGAVSKAKAKTAKPTTAAAKPAGKAQLKRKAADVAAPKLAVKASKSKKAKTATASVKSPVKKVVAKPKKVVPKPKSVKSPIKKKAAASAKKSRK